MSIESNWNRIKKHQSKLEKEELRGLAQVLFKDQEQWLGSVLKEHQDQGLAAEFLGYLAAAGSEQSCHLLIKALEEREEALQLAAVGALKEAPVHLILEPLLRLFQSQSYSAVKAGEVIISFVPEGLNALWQLWFAKETSAGLKVQILRLFTEAKDSRCEILAFLALLEGEEALAVAAIQGAERLDLTDLWGNLLPYLDHNSWQLRGKTALLLGRWQVKAALPYLESRGQDQDPWVEEERQKAIKILKEI